MPVSKSRRRSRSGPRRRDKAREARARATQLAQENAATKKISPQAYARWRFLGWSLVVLGVVIFVQHLISHTGAFSLISPGVDDWVAGYPTAGILGIAGVIVLSRWSS